VVPVTPAAGSLRVGHDHRSMWGATVGELRGHVVSRPD